MKIPPHDPNLHFPLRRNDSQSLRKASNPKLTYTTTCGGDDCECDRCCFLLLLCFFLRTRRFGWLFVSSIVVLLPPLWSTTNNQSGTTLLRPFVGGSTMIISMNGIFHTIPSLLFSLYCIVISVVIMSMAFLDTYLYFWSLVPSSLLILSLLLLVLVLLLTLAMVRSKHSLLYGFSSELTRLHRLEGKTEWDWFCCQRQYHLNWFPLCLRSIFKHNLMQSIILFSPYDKTENSVNITSLVMTFPTWLKTAENVLKPKLVSRTQCSARRLWNTSNYACWASKVLFLKLCLIPQWSVAIAWPYARQFE